MGAQSSMVLVSHVNQKFKFCVIFYQMKTTFQLLYVQQWPWRQMGLSTVTLPIHGFASDDAIAWTTSSGNALLITIFSTLCLKKVPTCNFVKS